MIVTVTPNPALDHTVAVTTVRVGEVNRVGSSTVEPSGKGVNVALALHTAGVPVRAVLTCGGESGRRLVEMLAARHLSFDAVEVAEPTRRNVALLEQAGRVTKLNEPGGRLDPDEAAALVGASLRELGTGDWVAWCGSLPAGFPSALLVEAVRESRARGARVALDTSGDALAAAVEGQPTAVPHLLKPNAAELSELWGRPIITVGDAVAAAREVLERGVETVVVTLGADGAVLVDRDGAFYGPAVPVSVSNPTGAGDAFLAGYLAEADGPAAARLSSGLRASAAAVATRGTLLDRALLPARAEVRPAEPDTVLTAPALPDAER